MILCSSIAQEAELTFVERKIDYQSFVEVPMIKNQNKYRGRQTTYFKCDNGQELNYHDNFADDNYVQFRELGVIKDSLIVVEKATYNSELYIIVDTKNCREIILEGFPLQLENSEKYIVYNNPSTDELQKIQILNYKNGFFRVDRIIIIPHDIKILKVVRIEKDEIYFQDEANKIWKKSAN